MKDILSLISKSIAIATIVIFTVFLCAGMFAVIILNPIVSITAIVLILLGVNLFYWIDNGEF